MTSDSQVIKTKASRHNETDETTGKENTFQITAKLPTF